MDIVKLLRDHDRLRKILAAVLTVKISIQIFFRLAWRRLLGFRSLVDRRFNYGPIDEDHVTLPFLPVQLLKAVIFIRGVFHNNYLLPSLAKHSMKQIEASLRGTPKRTPKDLPRVNINEIGPAEFFERFVKTCHPVVLTGVQFDRSRWNFDYFKKNYSSKSVIVTDLNSGKSTRRELACLFNQSAQERLYVHNCESLWTDDPELLKSLHLEQFNEYLHRDSKCAQIFMGFGENTGTDMHCANNFNVFFQLKGAKKWRFVNPEYTPLVYPVVSRVNGYFGSFVNYHADEEQIEEVRRVFEHCPRFETVVQEGEVLFNPPFWWHSVSAVPETPGTISVSTRWGSTSLSTIFGDINMKIDCNETNHLFTTLQLPVTLGALYPGVLHQIRQTFGKAALGVSLPINSIDTIFEDTSHDDIPEELPTGKLFAAYGFAKRAP